VTCIRLDAVRCMHHSRVCALLIDTPRPRPLPRPRPPFWSAALGATARPVPHEPRFTLLHQALPGLVTAVQAVDDAPRCPLGIETGNVAAQTARLLALGAVPAAQWLECRVLRAPGGHPLCVIPVHRDPGAFKAHATTWP
jgi:Glyoxalase-like domain